MKYWWLLFLILFSTEGLCQSLEEKEAIDSLKTIAEGDFPDTTRIRAYLEWDNLIYIADPNLDFKINQTVLDICNNNLNRSDLNLREYRFYAQYKSVSHNIIGLVLLDYGDLIPATEHLQQSFSIAEKLQDTSLMANATNNLGMVYNLQDNDQKSLEYYEKSMALDGNDPLSRSIYLNNIAMCYQGMGDKSKAMNYYRESLNLAEESEYTIGMANTLGNIGEMFYEEEAYDSAVFYYNQGIKLYEGLDNVNGHVFLLYRLGLTFIKINDPNKAIRYCQEGLDLLGSERSNRNRMSCHECLYRAYRMQGNTGKALDHFELTQQFSDSLLSDDKNTELVQNQFRFEYEKQRVTDSLNFAKEQELSNLKIKEQDAQIQNAFTQRLALFSGLALVVLFAFFIYNRLKVTQSQKLEIEDHKNLLQIKNEEILDSITYAKRIQEAILPPDWYIKEWLPSCFVLYLPKDIVAGDFYWVEQINGTVYFAAADCTGHGVPGAMVSVVCHNALNRSVREFGLSAPSEILNKTRDLILETFEKSDKEVKDGMDIALCAWNPSTLKLEYAGANNSLYLIRNGELIEYKADKQPIGKYAYAKDFTNNQVELQKGDQIYVFTDGYADQFGGEKGKKLKQSSFKEILLKNNQLSIEDQKSQLQMAFNQWKGDLEQVDDVCVIGIQV